MKLDEQGVSNKDLALFFRACGQDEMFVNVSVYLVAKQSAGFE